MQPETRKQLRDLVQTFEKMFGPADNNQLINTQAEVEIKTKTDQPIYAKSYPYHSRMRQEVKSQMNINADIIRPSKSPYNSPVWVVEKKVDVSGIRKYRMGIDFKKLNAVTVPDTYPIPDISNTIASLGDSKFLTTIDLTSGFHQIKVKERDIPETVFSIMNGKFDYTLLPFGLKNALSIF